MALTNEFLCLRRAGADFVKELVKFLRSTTCIEGIHHPHCLPEAIVRPFPSPTISMSSLQ